MLCLIYILRYKKKVYFKIRFLKNFINLIFCEGYILVQGLLNFLKLNILIKKYRDF